MYWARFHCNCACPLAVTGHNRDVDSCFRCNCLPSFCVRQVVLSYATNQAVGHVYCDHPRSLVDYCKFLMGCIDCSDHVWSTTCRIVIYVVALSNPQLPQVSSNIAHKNGRSTAFHDVSSDVLGGGHWTVACFRLKLEIN